MKGPPACGMGLIYMRRVPWYVSAYVKSHPGISVSSGGSGSGSGVGVGAGSGVTAGGRAGSGVLSPPG